MLFKGVHYRLKPCTRGHRPTELTRESTEILKTENTLHAASHSVTGRCGESLAHVTETPALKPSFSLQLCHWTAIVF